MRRFARVRWIPCLVAAAAVPAAGCSIQADAIRTDYTSYNQTIHFNESQQMLLNLVRMKYRESPLFLKVGALSSSYDIGVNAAARFGRVADVGNWGVDVGSNYSMRPTITYTPLEGNTFVKQVLAEIAPETFVLLFRSGWPMRTLIHILVESIGTAINNEDDPTYEEFKAIAERAHETWKHGALELATDPNGVLVITVSENGETTMTPFTDYHLRSLMDIMFFLGKNTTVPAEHAGQAKEGPANGWIHIHASRGRPADALVWVEHNGWFYSIDRTDIRSKDTFALLKMLFQIQAGDIATVQPILTLPVATP